MKWNRLPLRFTLRFLAVAAVVGVASALFSQAVEYAQWFCLKIYSLNRFSMWLYTPLLFCLIVYLLKKFFPYADGSGLPQGYAVDIFDSDRLAKTYSLVTAAGKALLTFASIAAGAALGKEGPTIQICSSLFATIQSISEGKRRLLIKLGAGVGVATAFNAPLGGMIFALEEYIKKISPRIATLLVGATLMAVYTSTQIEGNNPYLGLIDEKQLAYAGTTLFYALVLGVVCGLSGALFTKIIVFVSVNQRWAFNRWRRQHFLLNALICGLIVAALGYLSAGYSFGNGAAATRLFLDNEQGAPWFFAIAKAGGAIASVAAGVPGGYFSTALSIGAGLGDLVYHVVANVPLSQLYLLGMAGFLAAITQSPLTTVVMIVEMSNSSQFSMPILLAAFIASLIAEQFGDSVYHQQVLNYIDPRRYRETL